MDLSQLQTPKQIITNYPEIAERATANDLGVLLKVKLVEGKKENHFTLLNVNSVLTLFKIKK